MDLIQPNLFIEVLVNYNFRDKYRPHQPQFHINTCGFRTLSTVGQNVATVCHVRSWTPIISTNLRNYYRVVPDLWSIQTGNVRIPISISNSRIYNISLGIICGRGYHHSQIMLYFSCDLRRESTPVLSTDVFSWIFVRVCVCVCGSFNFAFAIYILVVFIVQMSFLCWAMSQLSEIFRGGVKERFIWTWNGSA